MKNAIKRAALCLLNWAPIYRVLRRRALKDSPLTVLCYHTLRPDDEPLDAWLALRLGDFRRQVETLRRHYDIVSLDAGLSPAAPGSRPRVVLTFDDGEVGLYSHLLPFIEAEKLPVTIYVATSQIEAGQPYWFDRVMNGLQGNGPIRINLQADGLAAWTVGPERGKARWQAIGDILQALKDMPPPERDRLADAIVGQAGPIIDSFTPLAPMTIPQLQKLASNPLVTIGAHSHCHNLLDQIPLAQARTSIAQSRNLLKEWTGQEVRHFAYPNGNYIPELMAEIADLGFVSASILGDRLAPSGVDPFALPRIGVGRYDVLHRFRLRLVGV